VVWGGVGGGVGVGGVCCWGGTIRGVAALLGVLEGGGVGSGVVRVGKVSLVGGRSWWGGWVSGVREDFVGLRFYR